MRNVPEKIFKQTFHVKYFFFRQLCHLRDNIEKCGTVGVTTDDSIIRQGYRHILKICTAYSFSTATMVMRVQLNVTLYVHSF